VSAAARLRRLVPPAATIAALLILWEAASRFGGLPAWLLPSPSAIVQAGLSVDAGQWLRHLLATLRIVVLGFAVALAVSLPLAFAITQSDLIRRCVYPILVVIQSTPIVAIAPILIVTFGPTDVPRVIITAMIAFFPLVVGISTGLAETPPELVELSRSLGAPRWRQYWEIRMPAAVPYIFAAVKISITLAVIGAVVAEFVAAEEGIGYFIRASTAFFKIPRAFAALAVLVAISLGLFHLTVLVQRLLFPRSLKTATDK